MENIVTTASMMTVPYVWFAFLSTCCVAWPTPYRRSYQYFPPMMDAELGPSSTNHWNIAQEPISYEQTEDYNDTPEWTDIEAISNLIDMYDNSPLVWGQIVNEKPEDELHELKRSQPTRKANNERIERQNVQVVPQEKSNVYFTVGKSPTQKPQTEFASQKPQQQKEKQFHLGQKEFPLLRPPVKPKASPTSKPGIISAQLNSAERQKKPSPYDTLRKYLSIEDALKKEVEKRRSEGRHQKRSNFVSEVGSLTRQLNNLKKTMT